MENLPINTLTTTVTAIVLGVFAVLSIIDRIWGKRNKELSEADDRLIELLNQQIKALEQRVVSAEGQVQAMTVRVEGLETENKLLRSVLENRDGKFQEFMDKSFDMMEIMPKLVDMTTKTNGNVEKLIKALDRHLTNVQKT